MNVTCFRCAALAAVAAVTAFSFVAGFPGTALSGGASSALALAPGLLCAAALLLLPPLDKGWAYVVGAVALLAVPGAAVAVTAVMTQHDAGVHPAFITAESTSWAAAFAVAERWVVPACLSSVALLSSSSPGLLARARTSVFSTIAQEALVAAVFVIPVLWWALTRPRSHDVCSAVLSPAGKRGPMPPDERALRALLAHLTVCFLVMCSWLALHVLRVRWAVRWHAAAVWVMAAALIVVAHGATPSAPVPSPHTVSLFGLSVLQVHHLLRLGVVTAVVPLLCATAMSPQDEPEADASAANCDTDCGWVLETEKAVQTV